MLTSGDEQKAVSLAPVAPAGIESEKTDGGAGPIRRFFASLRRRTSTGRYMPELDGLRFVAIATVFFYHLTGDIQRHSPPGVRYDSSGLFQLALRLNVGVPLFFVISGMILSLPFANHLLLGKKKVRLSDYFLRRLTRLEPPYLVTLIFFFLLKTLNDRGSVAELLPHLFSSMFYVHNLVFRQPSAINIVAWSLEIEVQFYVLVPLLVRIFTLRSTQLRRAALCSIILLFSVMNASPDFNKLFHLSLIGNIQYFLVGFLLTDLYLAGALAQSMGHVWDVASAIGWPLAALGLLYGGPAFGAILPFVILFLYSATFKGFHANRFFGSLALASIGGMCYSIYLTHNYTIAATGFLTERILMDASFPVRLLVQTVMHSATVLAVSVILYKLIEQPCMDPKWPSRLALKVRTLF